MSSSVCMPLLPTEQQRDGMGKNSPEQLIFETYGGGGAGRGPRGSETRRIPPGFAARRYGGADVKNHRFN